MKNKGITLIALVVTIVVLLILTSVTISIIMNNNGVVNKAKYATNEMNGQQAKEKLILALHDANIEKAKNDTNNLEEILDSVLMRNIPNAIVNDEVVIIEKYAFIINREKLTIEEELGFSDSIISNSTKQSILGKVQGIGNTGYENFSINGKIGETEETQTYSVHAIVYKGDLILDGTTEVEGAVLTNKVYEFGDAVTDAGTSTEYAKNMVILKVDGNLTINEGITVTACKDASGYGGPKGLLIYTTKTLTNNGTISMTARGARAEGQNVYLWRNNDKGYEYVPQSGASGASGGLNVAAKTGGAGIERQTGGGANGYARTYGSGKAYGGSGSAGTSYSGGTGGGGAYGSGANTRSAGSGEGNGGAGGAGTWSGGPGAGNPSGGTGGLLIIYADNIANNGIISSDGSNGYSGAAENQCGGGGSAGGSINIFYRNSCTKGEVTTNGGAGGVASRTGGIGGSGTATVGNIETGTFVKMAE